MKALLILSVLALSATQIFARTRVLRDTEAAPAPAPAAQGEAAAESSPHPTVDGILKRALGALKRHANDDLKKDIQEFETHLGNGDFTPIIMAVREDLQGKTINVQTLLKSIKEHAQESEYKDLITRVGKAGQEAIEKLRANHDARAEKIGEHIKGAVDAVRMAVQGESATEASA